MTKTDGRWRYSRRARSDDPLEGWKLHVSATSLNAGDVFFSAWPVLTSADLLFKIPAELHLLEDLNTGLTEFSQVGKFITVYPRSTSEAVELAEQLHVATRRLHSPQVPFDLRYRKNSIVYYRYGSFRSNRKTQAGFITDPAGKKHPDRRAPGSAVPPWIEDPFVRRGRKPKRDLAGWPLGSDYLVFRALSQRGKGGVYEALDLSVTPVRRVIIKEGRRDGETAWDGEDGFARVTREGRLLRELQRAGVPVPRVFRDFNRNRNRYLVLEKIEGRPLLGQKRVQPSRCSWRGARTFLQRIEPLLSQIHARGWVWRDCKPSHIFLHRGRISVIDFEGACRIAETNVWPWASPAYVPPIYRGASSRRSGTLEDDYAMGVIAFQLLAGRFPPESIVRRRAIYRRTKCPEAISRQIEQLLRLPSRATQIPLRG